MPSLLEQELASQAIDVESIECCEDCCDARLGKAKLHSIVKSLRLLDTASEPILRTESSPDSPSLNLSKETCLKIEWMRTYREIEGVLLAFLDYYGIRPNTIRDLTGDAFFLGVVEAFDDVKNPLHSVLGVVCVEELGSRITAVPILRRFINHMRLRRTWFLSQCLANSETLEIASFDCYYDLYYTVLFHYLVQCVGICMRDASQTECSATCKTKDGSREQGMARSKQAFTCEADRCARKFDTGDKLKQHASNQHQASSPTTTTEPQSIDEAGFAIEEGAHAKLLGITVQASVEAKATASRLRISDQLRELMDEVPISRTGTWQQLQGPIRRAATRPYRAPPPFQGAKSRDTSNANKSAKPVEVLAGTTTSLARFGNVEGAHDTTKKPEAVNAQARPSDSGTSLVKPHIAHFKEIGSTSLVLSAQDVEVKPQYFTKPAENSTALQMVLAELSRGKRLLALARHENAVLIQERNDLRSKLFRVSEEQTALFQKAKADTAEELRREFNTVVDSLIRSA